MAYDTETNFQLSC